MGKCPYCVTEELRDKRNILSFDRERCNACPDYYHYFLRSSLFSHSLTLSFSITSTGAATMPAELQERVPVPHHHAGIAAPNIEKVAMHQQAAAAATKQGSKAPLFLQHQHAEGVLDRWCCSTARDWHHQQGWCWSCTGSSAAPA